MTPKNPFQFFIQTLLILLLRRTELTVLPVTDAQLIWLLGIDGAACEVAINFSAFEIVVGSARTTSASPLEDMTTPSASTLPILLLRRTELTVLPITDVQLIWLPDIYGTSCEVATNFSAFEIVVGSTRSTMATKVTRSQRADGTTENQE
ncbi:hypothetical protein MRX96_042107 [Rhipicephalus microplus]